MSVSGAAGNSRVSRWSLARVRHDRTLRREADLMAFTVCIALLAALSYGDDHASHSELDVLVVVWGTTMGLALTQWFALTLSVRLLGDPAHTYGQLEMLLVQLVMAALVAGVATIAVLVLSADLERLGARVTAALFLGGLVGVEGRAGGSSWGRATVFAVVALVIGFSIATVKWYIGS